MALQHHRVPSMLLEVQLGQRVVDKRNHGSWLSKITVILKHLEVQLGQRKVDIVVSHQQRQDSILGCYKRVFNLRSLNLQRAIDLAAILRK